MDDNGCKVIAERDWEISVPLDLRRGYGPVEPEKSIFSDPCDEAADGRHPVLVRRLAEVRDDFLVFLGEIMPTDDNEILFKRRMLAEEALANALRWGTKYDPELKVKVKIRIEETADALSRSLRLVFEIWDEGPDFDLERVPDPTDEKNIEIPHGRGLLLIRGLCEAEIVKDATGKKGKTLRFIKVLK